MSATGWRARGACVGKPPAWWFSGYQCDRDHARAICYGCPVRAVCLGSQLDYEAEIGHVTDGMFGGYTPEGRSVLLGMRTTAEALA